MRKTHVMTAAEKSAIMSDRRVVTVLFTDVSGFTAMSEKLDPEEVTEIVNQFFAVLTEPIYRFGGVVDKYIGDAIMALFGAPIAHEDDPERALWAAYEMQRAAKEFAAKLEAKTGIGLRIRIGINTGLVVAGAVGGAQKQDYTVMGDTVNLAQRMESNAGLGKVLVSGETYRLARHRFSFTTLDPITVKGKAQPVEVYELEGPLKQVEDQNPDAHPFVNRQRELDSLVLGWERAALGYPQLVVVSGEAGMGKSRLLSQFLSQRCQPSPLGLRARCQSYTQGSTFGMVSNLLHYLTKTTPHMPLNEVRTALESRCRDFAPDDASRMADLLGTFMGVEPSSSEIASLGQEQRRNAALEALNGLLLALTKVQPVMLSVEDLQWADEASLEWLKLFLDTLSHQPERQRMMIVVQHRPGMTFDAQTHWKLDLTVIQVRPLEAPDSQKLLVSLLGTMPDAASSPGLAILLKQVQDRAEGNPFYLKELVFSLIDGGILVRVQDAWQVQRPSSEFKMPSTIQGAVASRLDRLPHFKRSLLQVASVLGRTFSQAFLAKVAGTALPVPGLEELTKSNFLYQNSSGDYAFTQALTQEVAYQSLLLSSRKELHGRAGLALEGLYADHLDENAHILAYHFALAEDFVRALRYQVKAAQRAFDFFDLATAKTAIDRALQMIDQHPDLGGPQRWEILYLKGLILTPLNQFEEGHAVLDAAFELLSEPQPQAKVLLAKGDIFERQANYANALETYQQGYNLLPAEFTTERASMLAKVAYGKYRLGEQEACQMLCHEALALIEGGNHPKEAGFAHSVLGLCLWRLGSLDLAIQHTQFAMQHREAAKDLLGVATSCNNIASIYSDSGETTLAEQYYLRGLQAYERIGDGYFISKAHNNLGDLLLAMGKLAEAEVHLRKALDIQQRLQHKDILATILFNLGNVLSYRGKLEEALTFMRKGLSIFESLDVREVYPEVYRSIALTCAEANLYAEAQESLDRAVHFAQEMGDPVTPAVVLRIQGLLALKAGDREGATGKTTEAIARLSDVDAPLELGRAYALLARLSAGSPAGEQAQQQARELFERLGAQMDLTQLNDAAQLQE
jgi:class 3 adenylate cyclase/tetratricopeptide (TPR) repeat protein